MNISEMHYNFKLKLNKIDSQEKRNFQVPEIDYLLNEAQYIAIKTIAEPRYRTMLGFESSQRNVDDISTIVITPDYVSASGPGIIKVINNIVTLPTDYMFFLRGRCGMKKDTCEERLCEFVRRKHNDNFEESPFDRSSFEWRRINGIFVKEGIRLFPDKEATTFFLSYIKRPVYMHNAKDFNQQKYKNFDGTMLVGQVNCELPNQLHSEIVDIAVLLASGAIQAQDFNIQQYKMSLNQLTN